MLLEKFKLFQTFNETPEIYHTRLLQQRSVDFVKLL